VIYNEELKITQLFMKDGTKVHGS